MTFGDRIKEARMRLGYSQSDLARRMSLRPQSIQQWENGQTQPRSRRLDQLALALNVSKTWLLEGGSTTSVRIPSNAMRDVPMINYVQAGSWSEVVPDAQDLRTVTCPVSCSEHTFALEVVGESMEPRYFAGDVIFVDPIAQAENGDDVIAMLDDNSEATFKRLVIEPGGKRLKALNPEWQPRYISINGNCAIIGVVIYIGRDPRK